MRGFSSVTWASNSSLEDQDSRTTPSLAGNIIIIFMSCKTKVTQNYITKRTQCLETTLSIKNGTINKFVN
jgi:hypothetical protein